MTKARDEKTRLTEGATDELTVDDDTSTGDVAPVLPVIDGVLIQQTQVTSRSSMLATVVDTGPTIPLAEPTLAPPAEYASDVATQIPSDEHLLHEFSEPRPLAPGPISPLGSGSTISNVGPYRVNRRLGIGGMAEVFLAEQTSPADFRKQVVVKRILPHLHFHSENVELFLREARTAARLSHPNVVQIFELGTDDSGYYLAMEYVDGLTTNDLMRFAWGQGESVPIEVVVQIIADAARGLHHAHELRGDNGEPLHLVHRDISADNLMLSRDGMTKVLDFGIAKGTQSPAVTRTGELKGKIPYMSPEQIRCEPLDRRSDLYSLGVILYWMLTGKRPFVGTSEFVIMNSIIHNEPVPLREKNDAVPASLEKVVLRLLAKSPSDRFIDGQELAETLEKLVPASREKSAAFAQKMMQRREEGGPQRASTLPGFPAAVLNASGQVESVQTHETGMETEGAPPIALKKSGVPAQTVALRGTVERREHVTEQRKHKDKRWLAVASISVIALLIAASIFSSTSTEALDSTGPSALQNAVPSQGDDNAPSQDKSSLPPANTSLPTQAAPPPSFETKESARPLQAAERVTVAPPKKAKAAPKGRTQRTRAARQPLAPPAPSAAPMQSVRTKAPRRIEWRSLANQVLGKGTGTLKIPEGDDALLAYDMLRKIKTKLAIRGGGVDYEDAPRGTLEVRLFPYGDVYIGEEKLGTTPFAPVKLVAGRYLLRIVYEGKEREERVSISEGKSTKVKLNLMKP